MLKNKKSICFLLLFAIILTVIIVTEEPKKEATLTEKENTSFVSVTESKEESVSEEEQKTDEKEKFYIILTSENSGSNTEVLYSSEAKDREVRDYIAVSTHCVIGEFKRVTFVEDYLVEYEFINRKNIYGKETDEIIRVRVQCNSSGKISGNLCEESFITGHKYILILERTDTLFLGYPYYSFQGYFVMDIADIHNSKWGKGTVHISKNATADDVINYIENESKSVGYYECDNINYFRTEDVETVVKNCDAIFKITPWNVISEGLYDNRTVYMCTSSEVYKGKLETNEENFVFIVTFKDSLELGKDYILPVSYVEAECFYHQASPICIFDASNTEMEAQIREWLSEKNVVNG